MRRMLVQTHLERRHSQGILRYVDQLLDLLSDSLSEGFKG